MTDVNASNYLIKGKLVKLKNRRVWLGRKKDGEYVTMTKCLVSAEKRADRVCVTKLQWTEEGLDVLLQLFLFEKARGANDSTRHRGSTPPD